MSYLSRAIANFTGKAANEARPVYSRAGLWGTALGGGPQASQTQQLAAMSSTSWLFAGVNKIAESVAAVDWDLYRLGPGERELVTARPGNSAEAVIADHFRRLWEMPNPFYTQTDFIHTSQQHFVLSGEFVWLLVRNDFGVIVEMWPLRPDRIKPVPHPTEFIAGYVYSVGSERIPLRREDIIRKLNPSPIDPYRGAGVVQTLFTDLESERAAAQVNLNLFRNDATPGGILSFDEELTDPEFEKVVDHWRQSHQGVSNVGRVAILERGTFTERKFTNRDMQFVDLRKFDRDLILGALSVPYALLGGSESINRANAEAANFMFSHSVVVPAVKRIREALNTQLLEPEMGLQYDYTDPTPEDRAQTVVEDRQRLNEAERGYKSGVFRRNEAREHMGLPPLPGGDVFFVEPGQGAQLLSARAVTLKALPDRDAPLHAAEVAMLEGWKVRLAAEAEAIAAYVEQFMKGLTKIEASDLAGYDWDWWSKYADDVIAELANVTVVAVMAQFPDLEIPIAQRIASEYAAAQTARILQATGDQNLSVLARRRVAELVSGTIERGDSLQTLQRSLREDLAFSPSRAENIARTETATAQGQGAKQAAAHFELDEKRWMTQGDGLVTAECAGNAGAGWIAIAEPFPSGHDTIPVHPRCRCNVIYRKAEPAERTAGLPLGTIVTVNCPQCGRRQPMNNVRGMVDAYCRHCDKNFPVSSEGAPQIKRTVKRVERDDDGRISFVEEQVIG